MSWSPFYFQINSFFSHAVFKCQVIFVGVFTVSHSLLLAVNSFSIAYFQFHPSTIHPAIHHHLSNAGGRSLFQRWLVNTPWTSRQVSPVSLSGNTDSFSSSISRSYHLHFQKIHQLLLFALNLKVFSDLLASGILLSEVRVCTSWMHFILLWPVKQTCPYQTESKED